MVPELPTIVNDNREERLCPCTVHTAESNTEEKLLNYLMAGTS